MRGRAAIRTLRQALFRADDLYARIPMGRGRHYHIIQPGFPFLILQDSTRHWTLHYAACSDAEMAGVFERAVALPVPFEMLSVNEWTQHLLCAAAYQRGRVFLVGDAAHLVIPTGGLGMNTGVGDAVDLSWKLWATLRGWGGPGLLTSYEAERRPVGLRNVRASGSAMRGRDTWRAAPQSADLAGGGLEVWPCREWVRSQGPGGADATICSRSHHHYHLVAPRTSRSTTRAHGFPFRPTSPVA